MAGRIRIGKDGTIIRGGSQGNGNTNGNSGIGNTGITPPYIPQTHYTPPQPKKKHTARNIMTAVSVVVAIIIIWAGISPNKSSPPTIITDIEFANVDSGGSILTPYGSTLYAEDMRYLKARITYSNTSSSEISDKLQIKILKPDGKPDGYSGEYAFTKDITIEGNKTEKIALSGWGNKDGGTSTTGDYTYIIFIQGKEAYRASVTLSAGTPAVVKASVNLRDAPSLQSNVIMPLPTSAHVTIIGNPGKGWARVSYNGKIGYSDASYLAEGQFTISRVEFSNEDADDNVLDAYGSTLYASKIKYLMARMTYSNTSSTSFSKSLYIKIINPDGSLRQTKSSPSGYSYMRNRNVSANASYKSVELGGIGTSSGGSYSAGIYKYEIWCDSEQLYSTSVTLR
jgi:uncharacterized protein YgiM (DUF1202 family)